MSLFLNFQIQIPVCAEIRLNVSENRVEVGCELCFVKFLFKDKILIDLIEKGWL